MIAEIFGDIVYVSAYWLLYVGILAYLIGWTSRHQGKEESELENQKFFITGLWIFMGVVTFLILGYTAAHHGWFR